MSTTPTGGPQTPGAMPAGVPPKKSNALLWVLGGCGTLVVIVILCIGGLYFYGIHKMKEAGIDPELAKRNPGLATAKLAVAMDPDSEMLSSDDNAGTIMVRNKKTGKVVKMRFDAAKKKMVITDDKGKETSFSADSDKGTLEIKSDEGTMKMGANADKPPDWVPIYPGSSPKNTYSMNDAREQSGTYVFTTSDAPEKVLSYYADQLKSGGLKVSTTTNTTDGKVAGMIVGEDADQKHTMTVTAGAGSDGTSVNVVFSSKR